MEIRFVKNYEGAFGKWVIGQRPDLMRSYALELIEKGYAVAGSAKPSEAQKTAKIVRDNRAAQQTQPVVVVLEDNS